MECPRIKKYFRPLSFKLFPKFEDAFFDFLSDCNSVLDLGCGPNSLVQYSNAPHKVGVELYEDYLNESKRKGIHNTYIKEDVAKVSFEPKSFDAVVMIDVIEHLSKEDGLELIKKMEKWARKRIIILTPNGFIHQDELDHNPLQTHKSGWNAKEFRGLGFRVAGINGLKWLRTERAGMRFKPTMLWIIISNITQKITYFFPTISYHLLAVKEVS